MDGFFFIDGVFYIDMENVTGVALVQTIISWLKEPLPHVYVSKTNRKRKNKDASAYDKHVKSESKTITSDSNHLLEGTCFSSGEGSKHTTRVERSPAGDETREVISAESLVSSSLLVDSEDAASPAAKSRWESLTASLLEIDSSIELCMKDIRVCCTDVNWRIGKSYLFCHGDGCEHLLFLTDIRGKHTALDDAVFVDSPIATTFQVSFIFVLDINPRL